MYLMQQMQPRAMTELTKTAINKIGQNVNISKQVMASIWYYCTCMQVPSEGREEYNICAVQQAKCLMIKFRFLLVRIETTAAIIDSWIEKIISTLVFTE